MGSPSYMAPEQAQGHAKEAGRGRGCLRGRCDPLRAADGPAAVSRHDRARDARASQDHRAVPPSRLVPGVPRDIETICLKCLQKEPAKRYETAQSLGDDLRRFLDGRPILARRISGVERAWRWCRRNRFLAGMTGIAAAAISSCRRGTLGGLHFSRQRPDRAARSARPIARRKKTCWNHSRRRPAPSRFSRQVGQRFESLDALDRAARIARELELPPERFDRIRDQAIACLALPDLKVTGRVIEAACRNVPVLLRFRYEPVCAAAPVGDDPRPPRRRRPGNRPLPGPGRS